MEGGKELLHGAETSVEEIMESIGAVAENIQKIASVSQEQSAAVEEFIWPKGDKSAISRGG